MGPASGYCICPTSSIFQFYSPSSRRRTRTKPPRATVKRAVYNIVMARAVDPFVGKHDGNKIYIRRDIVASLAAQRFPPHKIRDILLSSPETKWLIEGYANPYAIIRNDIKKGPTPLAMVTADAQSAALKELVRGLKQQLSSLWHTVNDGTDVVEKTENGPVTTEMPLAPLERLKYLEQIAEIEKTLARVQGVGTDEPAPVAPEGGNYTQQNFFGGGPEGLLQAAESARKLMSKAAPETAAPQIAAESILEVASEPVS